MPHMRVGRSLRTGTHSRQQRQFAAFVGLLGLLALISPIRAAMWPESRVGALLLAGAAMEIWHGFRRRNPDAQRAAWFSGGISLLMGGLLVNAPMVAGGALTLFMAGWFALDGIRALVSAWRAPGDARSRLYLAGPGIFNLAVALGIVLLQRYGIAWTVSIAGAMRLFATASNILAAPTLIGEDAGGSVLSDLGLDDSADLRELTARVEREEAARAPVDLAWIVTFLAVLFAVHVGRMGRDRTLLGLLSPAIAVLGDVVIAWVFAFALALPAYLLFRRLTRGVERRAWTWVLALPADAVPDWRRRIVRHWVLRRFRFAVRVRASRYSLGVALRRGMHMGLPVAAVLAATIPVWGMSWFFDTENWAAGMWNSWAESRTDEWREAMATRVIDAERQAGRPAPDFSVSPAGLDGDFSFIVIGDTGEGDASQHSLRDQLLRAAWQDDVRFVVLASDVIYPVGAARDYEAKFWLPFKGVDKPVFAIPGNHDWYDALEGFNAAFLEPEAARSAMHARVEADRRLSSTTDARIESLIRQAAELRAQYRVPTGFQKAPFFQVQSGSFALIAADTGVVKDLDPVELAWFRSALERSRGKFTMVILGHPLYAGGVYQATGNEAFAAIHRMLQEYDIPLVMAGDTHDLEYYVEPPRVTGRPGAVHMVNGGGGAYMSFGTALDWPASPATAQWAFYPTTAQVTEKLNALTPIWKWPAWWWTRRFGGWPFSAEGLAGIFDYNQAPFFQSFVVVRVEPSARRVRLWPVGVQGRLTWTDVQASAGLRPADVPATAPIEWTIPF